MAKNLISVNTNPDILKYDNRKAIELAQTLGRPLTSREYETLKIKKSGHCDPVAIRGKPDKPKCPR